jgi:uncharacterized membrane protein YqjE
MATAKTASDAPAALGLMEAIRAGLATGVALLKTRVELISTELEEQREWLEKIVFLSVASLVCVSLGTVMLTLFVTMLFWESYRLYVLGGFALLYLGGGAWAVATLRHSVKTKPRIFSTTASELEKDHRQLASPR